jgi:2-polyprenyl-6-methoxyphenol hydroxylase-like FAD-dependent oxidoreductase
MQVPILIVGAGPAGLCSSISLSRLGVRSLVVERHASTSIHPKATGISTRTMELFRSWGIEGRVREAAISARFSSSIRDALSGPEVDRRSLGYPTAAEAAAFSPTWAAVLAQDHLEPILLDHARSYSTAEVRFSTEVVDLEQTDTGVRATLVDRLTGIRTEIWSRYLVAADGANSPIRRRLGIATHGAERIGEYLSILFRADIASIVGPELSGLYMLQGLGGPAPSVALPTSDDGRWLLATPWRSDVRPISTLGPDDFVAIVRHAAGTPDLGVEVLDCQVVEIGAEVAERFRDGNVFLVGDAAHRTAPTGGAGMNTAIQSVHNLMWKLAAVLLGNAGDALLDSYDPERRPSGERNVQRSLGRLQGLSALAADLGVVYSSGAVVAGAEHERPAVIEPTAPACVGSRAPHVWVDVRGDRRSTLDLFGENFVLLTGNLGKAWHDAARDVCGALDITLGVASIGGAEIRVASDGWRAAYGIDADGAVLVRPDGHIAWRSAGAAADATATLEQVIARVLALDVEERRAAVAFRAGASGRRYG